MLYAIPDLLIVLTREHFVLLYAFCSIVFNQDSGVEHCSIALDCFTALSVCGLPFGYIHESLWTIHFSIQINAFNGLSVCLIGGSINCTYILFKSLLFIRFKLKSFNCIYLFTCIASYVKFSSMSISLFTVYVYCTWLFLTANKDLEVFIINVL